MPTSWGVLSRVGPARYPPDRCGLLLVSKSPGGTLFMGLGCLGLPLPLRASGGAGGAPPATGTLFLRCISCRLWQNASTFISSKRSLILPVWTCALSRSSFLPRGPPQGRLGGYRGGPQAGGATTWGRCGPWRGRWPGSPPSLPVAWLGISSPDIPVGPTCGCPSRLGGTPVGRGHCGD